MHRVVVTNPEGVVHAIAHGLQRALQNDLRVLWLLSGGSNVAIELEVLHHLSDANPHNLTISLIDERFVPVGSSDSNWQQLCDGGLTEAKARLIPVVTSMSKTAQAAAEDFEKRLTEVSKEVDIMVAQFGIGTDGHTAGILPHSPAVHEKRRLVVSYQAADFERITTTPVFFRQIDLAIAVAISKGKRHVVEQLATDIPPERQPAQLLKQTKEFILYTDQQVGWL